MADRTYRLYVKNCVCGVLGFFKIHTGKVTLAKSNASLVPSHLRLLLAPLFALRKVVAVDAHQHIKQDDERNAGKAEQDQQDDTQH